MQLAAFIENISSTVTDIRPPSLFTLYLWLNHFMSITVPVTFQITHCIISLLTGISNCPTHLHHMSWTICLHFTLILLDKQHDLVQPKQRLQHSGRPLSATTAKKLTSTQARVSAHNGTGINPQPVKPKCAGNMCTDCQLQWVDFAGSLFKSCSWEEIKHKSKSSSPLSPSASLSFRHAIPPLCTPSVSQ